MMSGAQWAAASAATLARRLRRQHRNEIGSSRANALAARCAIFRNSLSVHWALTDSLGEHRPSLREENEALGFVHGPGDLLVKGKEALVESNWARHAPPLGQTEGIQLCAMLLF